MLEDLKTRIQQVGDSPGRPGWGARAAGVTCAVLGAGAPGNTVALAITIASAVTNQFWRLRIGHDNVPGCNLSVSGLAAAPGAAEEIHILSNCHLCSLKNQ